MQFERFGLNSSQNLAIKRILLHKIVWFSNFQKKVLVFNNTQSSVNNKKETLNPFNIN